MKENLKVADRVRKAINRLNTSSELMSRAWFECFDNCREQGFVLQVWSTRDYKSRFIAFSENRNSDDIVVYCYSQVAYPSNLPDDDWKDNKYFNPNSVDEAAQYILKRAEEFLTAG
jgi:hypothetical protein